MAALNDLIQKIENPELRAQIQAAADRLTKQKKFGLVFEEHLPECTPLYDIPVRKGAKVSVRKGKANETYTVLKIEDGIATCLPKNSKEAVQFAVDDLVTTAELGDAIYPCLQPLGEVCNAPDSDLWHTLIEADNYHALQLLEYLYAGKVDCIYIDPPYNTGAKDWKYNNDYVDGNDEYRHSKWLSFIQKRLEIAKRLLNPNDSVLIVTIDEKEYLHLGCLLEEMFPEARIQMVSDVIHPSGVARTNQFSRVDEYIFFVALGNAAPAPSNDSMLDFEMTGDYGNKAGSGITWRRMIRAGSNSLRSHSENCFYPIFVDEKNETIHSIGFPPGRGVDRFSVAIPEGCVAVWPMHTNGDEGVWQISRPKLVEALKNGTARLGKRNRFGAWAMNYLSEGMVREIQEGSIIVKGRDEQGALILERGSDKKLPAKTVWNKKTHDATQYGSYLTNEILGKRFTYPKSVYSTHDTIRYYVENKPNALIVDFFAGSGTTLHAVNLLNTVDGGSRRCIIVTNNEISSEERKSFEARGIKQGDPEWESRGIARYVTWPRTVCSIIGRDVDGNTLNGDYGVQIESYVEDETEVFTADGKRITKKRYQKVKAETMPELAKIKKADGFKSNAVFFKLGFLDKTKVSLGMQFKELLSILWMKAGAVGKCPVVDAFVPDMLILPENKMAILNDENQFGEFAEQLAQHPEIEVIYLVTDYESSFVAMTQELEGKKTYQLYRDYLDNFRINAGRNSR